MSDGYIHWRISDQTERVDCSPFCWMCSETGSLCQIAEDGESFAIFLVFHSPPPLVFYKLFPPFLLPLFFLFFYFFLANFIYLFLVSLSGICVSARLRSEGFRVLPSQQGRLLQQRG